MRKLFLPSIIAMLLLVSCTTEKEMAARYIEKAYGLSGSEAASIYEEAVAETSDSTVYYNLAYSYLEAGEYDMAIRTADEALNLFPGMLRFMYLRAYALRESGRYYSYEKALGEILAYDPGNDDIRGMLLEHYIKTGRKKDAAALAKEAVLWTPENGDVLMALGYESAFFRAIAPSAGSPDIAEKKGRAWSEAPFIYSPLRILRGERLLSESSAAARQDS